MTHHAHLVEERLFDCYLAERGGEIVDPRLAEHLADCDACGRRYADLASFMDGLHTEGVVEADAFFSADRLRAQHQQIARRLELLGHRARVLSFPRRLVRGTMTPASPHATPRWLAAAAAAGLFIGVAVGASYNYGSHTPASFAASRQKPSLAATANRGTLAARASAGNTKPANAVNLANPENSDDAFLSELEVALERPHTRELQAFDALTPHARDVSLRR